MRERFFESKASLLQKSTSRVRRPISRARRYGPVAFLDVSHPGAPLAAENFRRLFTGEREGLSYTAPWLCVQGGDILSDQRDIDVHEGSAGNDRHVGQLRRRYPIRGAQ